MLLDAALERLWDASGPSAGVALGPDVACVARALVDDGARSVLATVEACVVLAASLPDPEHGLIYLSCVLAALRLPHDGFAAADQANVLAAARGPEWQIPWGSCRARVFTAVAECYVTCVVLARALKRPALVGNAMHWARHAFLAGTIVTMLRPKCFAAGSTFAAFIRRTRLRESNITGYHLKWRRDVLLDMIK